ncbi:MAG: sulfatase-like hydrolase/transferase, partial [Gemmatimonadaceae bacterium]
MRDTLTIALASAMTAALWRVAAAGESIVAGEISHVAHDYPWMVTLASLLLWGVIAVPAGMVARVLPRRLALFLTTAGFFTVAALSILVPQQWLARLSVALLSLGIGVAVARLVVDAPEAWIRRLAQASVAALLVLGGLAGWIIGSDEVARWRARSTLPPAAADAPNVMLIVIDAGRADVLSSYGYSRQTTPNIDALAQQGARFRLAISTAPWTLPSHITMFSGRYMIPDSSHSLHFRRPMETGFPVLAESFRDAGYETAGFVANTFYTGRDSGIDRGFVTYRDYPRTLEQVVRSSTIGQTELARALYHSRTWPEAWAALKRSDFTVPPQPHHARKPAEPLADEFLDWMARRDERPFFAFLNFFDAHTPYDPPPSFAQRFATSPNTRDLYDATVAYIDAEIGRIVESLRRRGELDRTLIVVTSDHGELFGEHGLYEHTSNLYLPVLHVPLVMRYPARVPAGMDVQSPVSLRDLAATLIDLSELKLREAYPGVSLATHFADDDSVPTRSPPFAAVERGIRSDSGLPFTKGSMMSLMDEQWHLIRTIGVGAEELYNYRHDPGE